LFHCDELNVGPHILVIVYDRVNYVVLFISLYLKILKSIRKILGVLIGM